jgi:hypothetical protein
MRTCTNCGTQITCGCQDRIASNGSKVCSTCLALYEQQLATEALIRQAELNKNSHNSNENIPT